MDDLSCGMVDKGPRFGGSVKRMSVYAEHRLYQGTTSNVDGANYVQKISAGPLESEDGKYMVGSMFILYCTREEANAFVENDPFTKAGVWEKVSIYRMLSIPNGIKPVRLEKDGDNLTTIRMIPDY